MKAALLIFVALFAANGALASQQAPIASCQKIAVYDQGGFKPAEITAIEIFTSDESSSGFTADIRTRGQTLQENDIELSGGNPRAAQEMAAILLPEIRWSDVAVVRLIDIGVEFNRKDGDGASITQLISKDQKLLGQMVTIGWSFGRCQ